MDDLKPALETDGDLCLVGNVDPDGRDHSAWVRCMTQVEPTIKV